MGAGAAMVGTVIGIVFNLLHPRNPDAFDSVEGELQMIADSGIWQLDHFMLTLSVAIGFVGLIAIALSMGGTPAELWARTGIIFGGASAAVALALLALDGTAVKNLADQWATGDESITGAATAMVEINIALLATTFILFFGITPLLFGRAFLASGIYPANLGYVEMVGGVLGILTGVMIAFDVGASFAGTILLPLSSLVHTVVLFIAGWLLWKRAATMSEIEPSMSTVS
jgi:hypothetical protein